MPTRLTRILNCSRIVVFAGVRTIIRRTNCTESLPVLFTNLDMDAIIDSVDDAQEVLEKQEEDVVMSGVDERKKLEQDAQSYLAEQTNQVIIPSYAAWFDASKVNDIEKRSNPEFFNGRNRSKNPSVYKDYRDFMINTYRLNPPEYLTVTACRRNLAGDVCAVMRVHSFLEQWGLINYQVDPESRPSVIGPPFTGHFRVTVDTPRGLQPFIPGNSSKLSKGRELQQTSDAITKTNIPDLAIELRKDVYSNSGRDIENTTLDASAERKQQCNCFTCGVDCSRVRYHCLNQKNFDLCPNCYQEGRFPSSSHSGDFVRMGPGNEDNSGLPWTDQETLLLLEGLEMYEEDWPKVSQHVSTRSKEQCILRFLQLPIEEPYLENTVREAGPLQYAAPPYTQTESPVMSVAAFLAAAVSPDSAAASAKSAISALRRSSQKDNEKPGNSTENLNQPQNGDSAGADHESADKESALNKAANVAFGTSAVKAHVLARNEDAQVNALLAELVTSQMAKLELKLRQFDEYEKVLEHERIDLDMARQDLYLQRLTLKRHLVEESASEPKLTVEHGEMTTSPNHDAPATAFLQP